MPCSKPKSYYGPALFSYGFRPFFLLALILATTSIPFWFAMLTGQVELETYFAPIDWHIHEMLFGYSSAVITGFLFTAIPNWTGRLPIRGWPLVMLVVIWISGRVAWLGIGHLDPTVVMVIDCSFLAVVVTMVLVEIIAGRNWRNLMVVIPVGLFLIANILFHVEVLTQGAADYSRRLGFAVVTFLIMLIGGRIIPSFTRNWLVKSNPGMLPVPFNRFDGVGIIFGGVALISWIGFPSFQVTNILLICAAVLHTVRMVRWRGYRTIRSPILLILHIAYSCIPIGLLVLGLGQETSGFHMLGIGAIGGMTVAVMIRATLGHTGRELKTDTLLTAAFMLILSAAVVRSALPSTVIFGLSGIEIATGLWTLAFLGILIRIGPWLLYSSPKRRNPNQS
jgi:uncharacterized protein involved in response to NO